MGAAGGKVSGTYAVRPALTDPAQKSLVDTLGSQLMTQLGDAVDADAPTYPRLGELLALAVAGDGAERRQSARASPAPSWSTRPRTPRPAEVVLVVLGDHTDPAILAGLTTGLAAEVDGRRGGG